MKRLAIAMLTSVVVALPARAALQAGDNAPDFKTQASFAGKAFSFSLKDAAKKGPVVVYFYPSAYTGGCNLQAHTFAVNKEKFDAVGATIVGVSLDSIERLNDFSADPEFCAGKIAVASDADGKIAKSYDLTIRPATEGRKDTRGIEINHGFAERTTFLVGSDGKIVSTMGGLTAAENVEAALKSAEQLAGRKTALK
jgi:peroxiredoxin